MDRGGKGSGYRPNSQKLFTMASGTLAATLILSGCGKTGSESVDTTETASEPTFITQNWPIARGSSRLNGSIADAVIQSPRIAWTFDAGSPISVDAAVYDGVVYIGSDSGQLFALDLEKGTRIWEFDSGDVIESEPAVSEDSIFFGSNNGKFFSLDRLSGEEKWSVEFDDKVTAGANLASSPDGSQNWLLIAGNDGVLRCLNAQDGSEVWSYLTDNYINGTPAMLDDEHVIFGGCDANLHILNLSNGEAVERWETEAYIPSTVAVYEGIGYGGNYANQVFAFDYQDYGELWIYMDRSFPFFSSPAVNEKFVFIGSRDKRLHAIDRETGEGIWTYSTLGRVDSSPLAFSDAVVFGSDDGWLYALGQTDGQELWKTELGAALVASPVFAAGKLLIGSQEGTLFALETGDTPNT